MKAFLGDRPSPGNNMAHKRRTKERTSEEWKELGLKFWSFSRLNAFETCPRMYELTYVKRLDETPNFFAEFGSFVHKIYEMYANGKLRRNQLLPYYRKHWKENVVTPAPYEVKGSDTSVYVLLYMLDRGESEVTGSAAVCAADLVYYAAEGERLWDL